MDIVADRRAVRRGEIVAEHVQRVAPAQRGVDDQRDQVRLRPMVLAQTPAGIGAGGVEIAQAGAAQAMHLRRPRPACARSCACSRHRAKRGSIGASSASGASPRPAEQGGGRGQHEAAHAMAHAGVDQPRAVAGILDEIAHRVAHALADQRTARRNGTPRPTARRPAPRPAGRASARSPSIRRAPGSTASRWPVRRLSSTTQAAPRSSSSATRWLPTKPAPPVTRNRFCIGYPPLRRPSVPQRPAGSATLRRAPAQAARRTKRRWRYCISRKASRAEVLGQPAARRQADGLEDHAGGALDVVQAIEGHGAAHIGGHAAAVVIRRPAGSLAQCQA